MAALKEGARAGAVFWLAFLAPPCRNSLLGDCAAFRGRQRGGPRMAALGCAQLAQADRERIAGIWLCLRFRCLAGRFLNDRALLLVGHTPLEGESNLDPSWI